LICLSVLCTLLPRAEAQQFAWLKYAESNLESIPANIVADGNGHVYVGGVSRSAMTFDGLSIANGSDGQSFLARCDEDGRRQWTQTTQCAYAEFITYLALDPRREHLYVTGGRKYPTGDRGPLFFAKYDTAGTLLWEWTIDSQGSAKTATMAVTTDGMIVAAGSTMLPTRVNGVSYPAGFFTTMMDASGRVIWYRPARKDSIPLTFTATQVATDPAGSIYVVGCIQSVPVDLDGGHVLYPGNRFRMFIIKYDSQGTIDWVRQNDGGQAYANGVAVDRDGNVLVTGFIIDTVRFGASVLACDGGSNMFVVTYDSAGNVLRVLHEGRGSFAEGNGIATMADGTFYVVGRTGKDARFGDIQTSAAGAFLAKYNTHGYCDYVVVARSTSGQPDAKGSFVAAPNHARIFMAGQFHDGCSFDPFFVTGDRFNDLFITRVLDPLSSGNEPVSTAPRVFELRQNYPNPFTSSTTVSFTLPRAGCVALDVCDILGRPLRRLCAGMRGAGLQTLQWEARDLPPGAYILRLQAEELSASRLVLKIPER
jgi:hypothetical protein